MRAKIGTILNDDPVTQLPDAPNAIASISVDLVELLFNELLNTGDAEYWDVGIEKVLRGAARNNKKLENALQGRRKYF